MASGIQGQSALSATTWTNVYEVPTGKLWTGNITVCNRNASLVKVRVGWSTGVSPASGEYIEYDMPLSAYGSTGNVLALTGRIAQEGKKLFVYSDTANVDVTVEGIER